MVLQVLGIPPRKAPAPIRVPADQLKRTVPSLYAVQQGGHGAPRVYRQGNRQTEGVTKLEGIWCSSWRRVQRKSHPGGSTSP